MVRAWHLTTLSVVDELEVPVVLLACRTLDKGTTVQTVRMATSRSGMEAAGGNLLSKKMSFQTLLPSKPSARLSCETSLVFVGETRRVGFSYKAEALQFIVWLEFLYFGH